MIKKEPFWAGLRRRANRWLKEMAEEIDLPLETTDDFDDITPETVEPKRLRDLDRRGEFFKEVHKEHARLTGTWKPKALDDMLETILHEYDTDPKRLRKYRHHRRRK